MNIFKRLTLIIKSFFNSFLDACEDPALMVDQFVREAENVVNQSRTALVNARVNVRKKERDIAAVQESLEKYQNYARKAYDQDNEDDMAVFAEKIISATQQLESEKQLLDESKKVLAECEDGYGLAIAKSREIRSKRDTLKTKADIIKMKKNLAKIGSLNDPYAEMYLGFAKLEDKIDLDNMALEEEAEVNQMTTSPDEVIRKYEELNRSDLISAKVQELKDQFAEGKAS